MDPATALIILGILQKIAVGAGVAALLKLAAKSPEAVRWLRRYVLGSNILVVGQARAGKTSFYNYLKHGEFADTHPTEPTDRVSKPMRFPVNRGADLQFNVSKAFDIPGDLPVSEQIDIVRRKRPKALMIFLSPLRENVEGWLPADEWFGQFTAQLRSLLVLDHKVAKHLRCLKVVLNKIDAINDADREQLLDKLHGILEEEWGKLFTTRLKNVKVIPCTLRKDKGGELSAKVIVLELVSCLRKNETLLKP